jgi:hypothetical protein
MGTDEHWIGQRTRQKHREYKHLVLDYLATKQVVMGLKPSQRTSKKLGLLVRHI